MQLYFTPPQLQLLADILSEQKAAQTEELLERLLARDFRLDFEEVELLTKVVSAQREELIAALAGNTSRESKTLLQKKKSELDNVLERLNEAAAMV